MKKALLTVCSFLFIFSLAFSIVPSVLAADGDPVSAPTSSTNTPTPQEPNLSTPLTEEEQHDQVESMFYATVFALLSYYVQ